MGFDLVVHKALIANFNREYLWLFVLVPAMMGILLARRSCPFIPLRSIIRALLAVVSLLAIVDLDNLVRRLSPVHAFLRSTQITSCSSDHAVSCASTSTDSDYFNAFTVCVPHFIPRINSSLAHHFLSTWTKL